MGPRRVGPRRVGPRRVGPEGWGPEGWAPEGWAPEGWGPEGWGPKISRFFFPSPATVFSFSLSFGLFRVILVVFDAPGPSNVHVWSSRPRRPGLVGPPGFHTTAREPKRAHFRVLVFKNTTKIQRKGPTREGEKNKNCGGRGKKKSEILGGPAEGGPAEGVPHRGPEHTHTHTHNNNTQQHTTTTQHTTTQKHNNNTTHNNTQQHRNTETQKHTTHNTHTTNKQKQTTENIFPHQNQPQ